MKIVIDTNVLIASFGKTSPYRIIYDSFLEKKFQLLVSDEVIWEYLEVLTNKTNPIIAHRFLETLSSARNTVLIRIFFRWLLVKADADDDKFCDLYISGNADYLVTNDKHFEVVKGISFPIIKIISADDFVQTLNAI